MTEKFHAIIGLPLSGKTTFLAALWHLIHAGEVKTKLILDRLVGDHAHLNAITEAWLRCEEVPRTPISSDATKVVIYAYAPEAGTKIALCFPDLAGEIYHAQFAERVCTPEYIADLATDGGIMMFVNANRGSDGMTLGDLAPAIERWEEEPESPTEAREWGPELAPEQVRLVDLLQFLQRPPFERRKRRLAVIVSAWDVVTTSNLTPEQWLAREMPLLQQFLTNNGDSFESRIYGVSAQGGELKDANRLALARCTPSERVRCYGIDADLHDLTAPIMWISEVGSDDG